jgi:NAD(P)H dehydrogenase (quinone)
MEPPLRVFILYANPVVASFGATLHKQVVTTLRSGGHETDDCDLYAESFDPVMVRRSGCNTIMSSSTGHRSGLMPIGY